MTRLPALFLTFLLVPLCGAVASDWAAPDAAARRTNPLANRPELAAGGEKIFNRVCHSCHTAAPGAERKKGPNFATAEVQNESDGTLFWKISNGNARTGMPSFSSLPEAQRWQLVLFIRSVGKRTPASE